MGNRTPLFLAWLATSAAVIALIGSCKANDSSKSADGDDSPSHPDQPQPPTQNEPGTNSGTAQPSDAATFERFPTAAAAIQSVMRNNPRVVGFGEYHQTNKSAKVINTLTRFRTEILPQIAGAATDLVLETWVEKSGCGKKAVATATDVKKTIDRPEKTENQLMTLLSAAKKAGLSPHMLEMSCDDYASFNKGGKVNYDLLLKAITERLLGKAEQILAKRTEEFKGKPLVPAVLIYGGGLHNDVEPLGKDKSYSYAARVSKLVNDSYIEIDILVPEFIAESTIYKGHSWFETAKTVVHNDDVLLFKKGPRAFVIILKHGRFDETTENDSAKATSKPN